MQFDRLKRREFIRLIGGAALTSLAAPLAAAHRVTRAAHRRAHRTAEDDPQTQPYFVGFKRPQELGWIDGRNIHVDYRFGATEVRRMQRFAKGSIATRSDRRQFRHHCARVRPRQLIIFVVVSGRRRIRREPVAPRRQHDGIRQRSFDGRQMGRVLKMSRPGARARFIYNQRPRPIPTICLHSRPRPDLLAWSRCVAGSPRRRYRGCHQRPRQDGQWPPVMPDTFTSTLRVFHHLPCPPSRSSDLHYRYMAAAGGLLAGTDNADLFRRVPTYIDRVLKGAKPAELPVQLPTKFEFIVNLKTARALDIDVPLKLRAFADEVIE